MIESRELEYTDKDYRGGNLELPEPIVPYSTVTEQDKEKVRREA